jgi:2-polyprenyl-3-methyl-5-hydroxy-6-metoxy-1,4-benzoquinol methylase
MKWFSRAIRRTSSLAERNPLGNDLSQPLFGVLLPKDPELRNLLIEFVGIVNNTGGSYHYLDFGDGIVMNGEYDMTRYLDNYGIPPDLTGKSVLDIGTASGFFALECARRGAQVTAIDVWDVGYYNKIIDILGVNIRYIQKSVYELDGTFGKFDLVICGSLLLHLRDVFGAIERIQSVCKRKVIVATASVENHQHDERACCEFVGTKNISPGGEYWVYWHLNSTALKKMLLAAGFSEAHEVGRFVLKSEPGRGGFAVPHIVVKAII